MQCLQFLRAPLRASASLARLQSGISSSRCLHSLHQHVNNTGIRVLNSGTQSRNGNQFRLDFIKKNPIFCRALQTLCRRNVTSVSTRPQLHLILCRRMTLRGPTPQHDKANKTGLIYICAIGVFMIGAAYAGVPLYRIFCQATGRGGQAVAGHDASKVATMTPVKDRILTVKFNADVASSMQWNFKPQQAEVRVLPGETALAFYTARNPTDKPIIGISTYNVVPFEAGAYFNKIQCFCFEEQRLNPREQVDMPVFFYIDPDFADDPKMATVEQITLSYTFFESKEGLNLPIPGYVQHQPQPQTYH